MADSVHLRYGQSGLDVRLPAHAVPTLIGKRPLAKLADPHAAVREALAQPVDAQPFRELARGRKSACILICDITRPVPNHLFLRPLIEGMLDAGSRKTTSRCSLRRACTGRTRARSSRSWATRGS